MNRDISAEDNQRGPVGRKPTLALFVAGVIMLIAPLGLVLTGVSNSVVSWLLYVMLAGGILLGYAMKRHFDSLRVNELKDD